MHRFSLLSGWRPVALAMAATTLLAPLAVPAAANSPKAPEFGPVIEEFADYEGQKRCKPKPKPGTQALADLLTATYPDTTWIGISRACDIGGTSEHKEGRALDWARDATNPAQRNTVSEFLDWLFATDNHGNENAMFRRLGIMYLIWNRRIWSTWDGDWDVYCVQKKRKCKDPDSKAALHPHTDHVHISLGWDGARMETSYWNPTLSMEDGQPPPGPEESPPPAEEEEPTSPDRIG
ncbi:MAG: hypothetical protein ACRDH9_13095 [Actinomycetota bacterium]